MTEQQLDPAALQVPASPKDHEDDPSRGVGVPGSAAWGSTASTGKGLSAATAKTHRCMRCLEPFACTHGPNCIAGEWVMPDIVTPDGLSTTPHCPRHPDWNWIREYGKRIAALQEDQYHLAERIVRYFRDSTVQAKVGHGHLIEGEVIAHVAEMLKGSQ